MKKCRKTLVLCILCLASVGAFGCSQSGGEASGSSKDNSAASETALNSGNTSQSASDDNGAASSQAAGTASDEEGTLSSADSSESIPDSSVPQASVPSPEELKKQEMIEEINILNEYRRSIPMEKDVVSERLTSNVSTETNSIPGKVFFVDAVIRDVNQDGHYEMVVKYDCRSKAAVQMHLEDGSYNRPVYIYDLVQVVNHKAVASDHYLDEEGWYDMGSGGH